MGQRPPGGNMNPHDRPSTVLELANMVVENELRDPQTYQVLVLCFLSGAVSVIDAGAYGGCARKRLTNHDTVLYATRYTAVTCLFSNVESRSACFIARLVTSACLLYMSQPNRRVIQAALPTTKAEKIIHIVMVHAKVHLLEVIQYILPSPMRK